MGQITTVKWYSILLKSTQQYLYQNSWWYGPVHCSYMSRHRRSMRLLWTDFPVIWLPRPTPFFSSMYRATSLFSPPLSDLQQQQVTMYCMPWVKGPSLVLEHKWLGVCRISVRVRFQRPNRHWSYITARSVIHNKPHPFCQVTERVDFLLWTSPCTLWKHLTAEIQAPAISNFWLRSESQRIGKAVQVCWLLVLL